MTKKIVFFYTILVCLGIVTCDAGPTRSFSINTGSASAAELTYTPGTASDWSSVPTTVTGALDGLSSTQIYKSQAANLHFASPNGSSGLMSARALVLADLPALQATKQLYVDGGRSDTYTADGTVLRPYKTIQAAINVALSGTYDIIVGPGSYAENLTFNNALMSSIRLIGHNSTIDPASGNAIASTTNNTSLTVLIIQGFTILDPVNLTGTSGFCGATCYLRDCAIQANVTVNTPNEVDFERNYMTGDVTATNTGTIAFREGPGSGGAVTLVNSFGIAENWLSIGNISIDATSTFAIRRGSRLGTSGNTVTVNGVMSLIQSFISSNIVVNNGGVLTNYAGSWFGTLTLNAGSTFSNAAPGAFNKALLGSGAVTATNAVLVTKDGHEKSTQTTAPVATVNANAGTSATCTLSNATDTAGTINLTTTATSPAAGAQCSIAFNKTYNTAPLCTVTGTNNNSILFAVANGDYFTTSTSALVVNYANADAIGHANTWAYHCIETQ